MSNLGYQQSRHAGPAPPTGGVNNGYDAPANPLQYNSKPPKFYNGLPCYTFPEGSIPVHNFSAVQQPGHARGMASQPPVDDMNTQECPKGHHLPGYGGHIQHGQQKFGKSYGKITRQIMSEDPRGVGQDYRYI
eukprot:CAMPEP_0175171564 /NCGR_PEP_ID=MMETSP0087-20121206/30918_1 /TAXON_ID=136419 /ORGANISM="Unknown Unknown, Strain D1" /LENGTH=132 /DNA_ID=CAMNT_0016462479 /DNA_START=172 /DNA_END=570 /DNA_ORIENTATION=+